MQVLLALCVWVALVGAAPPPRVSSVVTIKGSAQLQHLPYSLTNGWRAFTVDLQKRSIEEVDIPSEDSSWVNPSSYSDLFLPSDLPVPKASQGLGVALANGVPRYIMPSLVLTLETPSKVWRNRGINSLPRAHSWLDLFSPFCPSLPSLYLHSFGKVAEDVRFLEDIDGLTSWGYLQSARDRGAVFNPLLGGGGVKSWEVAGVFDEFKALLAEKNADGRYSDGYAFMDIVIPGSEVLLSDRHIIQYLCDYDDPKRFIEEMGDGSSGLGGNSLEQDSMINTEPIGILNVKVAQVAAGRKSQYLPEDYLDLYEEGNSFL